MKWTDKNQTRRNTRQRRLILEQLRKVKTHPTAWQILAMAQRYLKNISFGTVYRNLNLLKEQGDILELPQGKGPCRYDGNPRNHYHFSCLGCGRVLDIRLNLERKLEDKAKDCSGFKVLFHKLDFYGYCDRCKRR